MKYFILFLVIITVAGGIYLALFSTKHAPIFEKPNIDQKKSDYNRFIEQEDSKAIYELEANDKG